jgi:methionyl-tRNA formyltransferase
MTTPARAPQRRAIVFAYHDVGVRCLKVLIGGGLDVALVVTHRDAATENVWFASVAHIAQDYGLPVAMPEDPNAPEFIERVRGLSPGLLVSFYYRQMLAPALLAIPPMGAFNLHGSLLPHFRGRAPVNWAVLHGATETGASLHYMVAKPDAGDLVAQTAVPILPDDTAHDVFSKVTVAAELTLWRVLPALLAGQAPRQPLDLAAGRYFGGRRPEDGRIDWSWGARRIHDLVRAVAPPYPGAWGMLAGARLEVPSSRVLTDGRLGERHAARLVIADERIVLEATDGGRLWLRAATLDGQPLDAAALAARYVLPLTLA